MIIIIDSKWLPCSRQFLQNVLKFVTVSTNSLKELQITIIDLYQYLPVTARRQTFPEGSSKSWYVTNMFKGTCHPLDCHISFY